MDSTQLEIRIHSDMEALEAAWLQFEADAVCHPFQSYHWLVQFNRQIPQPDLIQHCIVALYDTGRLVALFPFVLKRKLGMKVLSWAGDSHSSYRGALYAADFLASLTPSTFQALWKRIAQALPHFDLLWLESQLETEGGHVSPFSLIQKTSSPNTSHQLVFPHHDWPELAKSLRNSKVRKRMRNEESRLHREGAVSWKQLESAAEVDLYLVEMFRQRAVRMTELGIGVEDEVDSYQLFYRQLLCDSLDAKDGRFSMLVLTLDDILLSAIVIFHWQNSMYPLINCMTDTEYRRWSPGEYMLRIMMQQACDQQVNMIEYGPGDAPYKVSWCNRHIPLYETISANSAKGAIGVAAVRFSTAVKRKIKNTPILWQSYLRLRKLRGGEITSSE